MLLDSFSDEDRKASIEPQDFRDQNHFVLPGHLQEGGWQMTDALLDRL